jgi:protein-S-isoprenylcysteine O-methyltransferase Ste14
MGKYTGRRLSPTVVGASFIGVSIPMLVDSFARFALRGLGTPAPVFPTKHLVVTGLYRNVRNPMYVGAVGLMVGQGVAARRFATAGVRSAGLVSLSFVCDRVRGTHAAQEFCL